ncbi:wHTH domain-containing protein [Streptomyces sp. NPDC002913]
MSHAPVESQDPDDLQLVSSNLNGHYPWLDPARPVLYGHVLYAASLQGRAPAAVASRLAELGYADVEHPETPWARLDRPRGRLAGEEGGARQLPAAMARCR